MEKKLRKHISTSFLYLLVLIAYSPVNAADIDVDQSSVWFSSQCPSGGNVQVSLDGVIEVSFDENFLLNSNNGRFASLTCQSTFRINIPADLRMVSVDAVANVLATVDADGRAATSLSLSKSGTTEVATYMRFSRGESKLYSISNSYASPTQACGEAVQLKLIISPLAKNAELNFLASSEAPILVDSEYSACNE